MKGILLETDLEIQVDFLEVEVATERILVIEVGINRSIDVSEFKVCKICF